MLDEELPHHSGGADITGRAPNDPFGQGLAAWPSMASTLNGIENHVRAEFSFSTPSAPPSTYSFKQFGEHRF
jgi:hypothetical protein